MNSKAFALWLSERREDAGLTQEGLASLVGVKKAYISKLENAHPGVPTLQRLLKISRALGTSLTDALIAMGYLRPERDLEPHVMRLLHYYQTLPKPEQRLAEELIKTLWRERGAQEDPKEAEKEKQPA